MSTPTSFFVTLYNLNYNTPIENPLFEEQKTGVSDKKQVFQEQKTGVSGEKQVFQEQKTGVSNEKQVFETLLLNLNVRISTKKNIIMLFQKFGFNFAFSRNDVMEIVGITSSPAGELIRKLKENKLIEAVNGQGKGKYKFVEQNRLNK